MTQQRVNGHTVYRMTVYIVLKRNIQNQCCAILIQVHDLERQGLLSGLGGVGLALHSYTNGLSKETKEIFLIWLNLLNI